MPRRRPTRAESQAQTRAGILAAAARVFAHRGYDGASIAEIAEEAGYSHGAVYSNFADKEDLFLGLYEEWVARRVVEIDAEREQTASLVDGARSGVDHWLQRLADDPAPFLLRLEFTARAARDPELRRKLAMRVSAVPLALERLNARIADAERRELALPPEEVTLAVQALSLGLALESLGNPSAVRPGLGGEIAARLIQALTAEDREPAC